MRSRFLVSLLVFSSVLISSACLHAELSRADVKAIKASFGGTLYLRVDAPVIAGFTGVGLAFEPLVEVSPQGSSTDKADFIPPGRAIQWNVTINEPVKLDEIDVDSDEGEIEVELDTVQEDSDHSVIKFVGIRSMADFQAAFDHAFARVPLQDEHPDWAAEIRQAIAERRLVAGMTKRQANYVVGMPVEVAESTEDGKQVVVWKLRATDFRLGLHRKSSSLPASLRFEDGKLVKIDSGSDQSTLDLDD